MAHVQAGVQVAPGWHWQLEPHLQFGPQAHDAAPCSVEAATAPVAESTLFVDEFI